MSSSPTLPTRPTPKGSTGPELRVGDYLTGGGRMDRNVGVGLNLDKLDTRYASPMAGASVQTLVLDASQGDDEQALPDPTQADFVQVVRSDDGSSGNLAAFYDPTKDTGQTNRNIHWWGRAPSVQFEMLPAQVVHVVSDGSSWYVEEPGQPTIVLDASGGDVTKTLPEPEQGMVVWVVRTDGTYANTATIEDPSVSGSGGSRDIVWWGRSPSPSFEVVPHQSVPFLSDGVQWYAQVETPVYYNAGAWVPGKPTADEVLIWVLLFETYDVTKVRTRVGTPATNNGTLGIVVDGGGPGNTGTVEAGSSKDLDLTASSEIQLRAPAPADPDLSGIAAAFQMTPR